MNEPSLTDYYKSWIAFHSLQKAVKETNYRSVWKLLSCSCCPEPHCWTSLDVLPISTQLEARIRWYDHVNILSYDTDRMDLSNEQIRGIQAHFVGHHQRIELILMALKPSIDKIYDLISSYEYLTDVPEAVVSYVVEECRYAANGWIAAGSLVQGVAKMNRIEYLKYVPRLAGVSGGNSPQMMPVTTRTANLEKLFDGLTDDELQESILTQDAAGRIVHGVMDLLDALSRCWMDHVVTATTAIGITSGTKGTPNVILVDRVMRRLHDSRLFKALGSLRSPLSGIGVEMKQLHDYETYPLASHYLDLFDDPGPEFGSHNVGYSPQVFDEAKRDFLKIRRDKRTNIWEYFYADIRPQLCVQLSRLLGVVDGTVHFGFGANVTEVLGRIVQSIGTQFGPENITSYLADDEFVTLQRSVVSLSRKGAALVRVPWEHLSTVALGAACVEKKHKDAIHGIVLVSLVNSCTQRVQNLDWILSLPESLIAVVDITQAISNLPLPKYGMDKLAAQPNVFVVGSLIKHGRCGEGLGFMTASSDHCDIAQPDSGWTSYLSGLKCNETADFEALSLLYENPLEWSGGTPGHVEAAYVANRILQVMPPVERQNSYVQGLQAYFLQRASSLLSAAQLERQFHAPSNTLAIPVAAPPKTKLPFGMDHKTVNGCTYVRIGFGIHNLLHHVDELVQELERLRIFDDAE